jgi:hypothetical protein
VLQQLYAIVKDVLAGVELCNIYNMDKIGLGVGMEECSRVVIHTSIYSTRCNTQPGKKKWLTVIECVRALDTTVPLVSYF